VVTPGEVIDIAWNPKALLLAYSWDESKEVTHT
jgi:hypothetical protein